MSNPNSTSLLEPTTLQSSPNFAAEQIKPLLTDIHDLPIDMDALQTHEMNPAHVQGIFSSKGLQEGTPHIDFPFPVGQVLHLDVAAFGVALHAALKDIVAGYVMRLRENGTTIYTLEWNWAKRPNDGAEGWNPDVRMHIASCSKLVTGMAMTKLLNDKKLSYDTPIIGYLPKYWAKGTNIDKITFRNLMTHTSGFVTGSSASDYEFMKSKVAAGVASVGSYNYENMNFGLCRILLATLNGNIAVDKMFSPPLPPSSNDIMWDSLTISAYTQYVTLHLFTPSGVSGPTLDHPDTDALAYNFPVSGNGWNSGNLASMCGGAGWHMSVDDLITIMGTFRRNNSIMSTAQAQTMLDSGFGIDVIMSTPLGTLYNKNGAWGNGSQEEQSLAYFLPQNMEMVVLVNSPVGSPAQFFRDKVTKIYLANIKP